jgi:hypothetical protein
MAKRKAAYKDTSTTRSKPKKASADSSRSKTRSTTVRVSGVLTGKSAASDTLARKDLIKLMKKKTLTKEEKMSILKDSRARMDIARKRVRRRK